MAYFKKKVHQQALHRYKNHEPGKPKAYRVLIVYGDRDAAEVFVQMK